MQISKTLTVTTTVGALTVSLTLEKTSLYVNNTLGILTKWTPVSGSFVTLVKDWGDGTVETVSLPGPSAGIYSTHQYTAAKAPCTIKFTVTDNTTHATGSGTGTLNVAALLTATFTSSPSPATGPAPFTVAFTFGMSGGFTPHTWTLDFGDGSTVLSNPTSPQSQTYTEGGKTYTATLTVTDALGASVTARLAILSSPIETFRRWWSTASTAQKALVATTIIAGIIGGAALAVRKLKR